MRILALETSSDRGSVALLDAARLICERPLPPGQRSAQSLIPTLDALFQRVGWTAGQLELIALTTGPGSFTGLRVGVTTAKTLAYIRGCPIVSVNTLEVLAAQGPPSCPRLACVMDAQRRQMFLGCYTTTADGLPRAAAPVTILDIEHWLQQLQDSPRESPVIVTGPLLDKLHPQLPAHTVTTPETTWQPSAATVGKLGWAHYQAGHTVDAWSLAPNYYRQSAAEEKHGLL